MDWDELARAARHGTGTEREVLLDAVSSAIVTRHGVSTSEVNAFAEIALALMPTVGVSARARLSERVADWKGLPLGFATALAEDAVVVASPILKRAQVFDEKGLIQFAERLSNPHRCAIADRKGLSRTVSHVLIEVGDVAVWRAIGNNGSAQIAPADIEKLVENAISDGDLAAILVRRRDVSMRDAKRLVPTVAVNLRRRFARPTADAEETVKRVNLKSMRLSEILEGIHASSLDVEEAIIQLAASDRSADLASVLADQSGFDDVSVVRVMMREDAHGIALLAKAQGYSDTAYRAIVDLRGKRLNRDARQRGYEMEDYRKLDPERCRRTLRQLTGQRPTAA
jgi:uncharacterized protein (DUF2336 family)